MLIIAAGIGLGVVDRWSSWTLESRHTHHASGVWLRAHHPTSCTVQSTGMASSAQATNCKNL